MPLVAFLAWHATDADLRDASEKAIEGVLRSPRKSESEERIGSRPYVDRPYGNIDRRMR